MFSIGRNYEGASPSASGNETTVKNPSRFLGAGNNDSTEGEEGEWLGFPKLKLPEALRKLSDSRRHAVYPLEYTGSLAALIFQGSVGVCESSGYLRPSDEFSTGSSYLDRASIVDGVMGVKLMGVNRDTLHPVPGIGAYRRLFDFQFSNE